MYNEWGNPWMNARGDMPIGESKLSEWPYYGLGPDTNRLYWTVRIDTAKLISFRCNSGQTGLPIRICASASLMILSACSTVGSQRTR